MVSRLPAKAGRHGTPTIEHPPLRVFSVPTGDTTEGVVKTKLDSVQVGMTGAARTVADCFKFRGKVGLEVALEALRAGFASRAYSPAIFAKYAKQNRVLALVCPYLESMARSGASQGVSRARCRRG